MDASTQGLTRGERAPDFVLPRQDGTPVRFYARAGGTPTVLVFFDASRADGLHRFVAALQQVAGAAFAILAVKYGVTIPQAGEEEDFPFPVFTADTEGKVCAAYCLSRNVPSTCFVLDPNLRVLGTLPLENAQATAQRVASILDEDIPQVEPREIIAQAPVLLIPHVLDRKICDFLIRVWEDRGHAATGVEQWQAGQHLDMVNPKAKIRCDHTVLDAKLLKLLSITVGRRLLPEIRKAFAYVATRFEGFKIACYDADMGGFFSPHRDNLSPSTAHRRFALTINLNDGYEGGGLRFAEYAPHLYRPGPGDAIVFACAVLHEVTPVTRGRRFTLLSFLFGEEGIRPASQKPQEGGEGMPSLDGQA
jgi:predicted 2-oxoglutarate/Fe(II)-dependent dioxygenase YbiX/peroxiredoxin